MSDVTVYYKNNAIATLDATGSETLLTEGKYCEDDIEVVYVKPSGGGSGPITIDDTEDSGGGTIRTITAHVIKQYWMWRDTDGVVRITDTNPTEEEDYAESIIVYADESQVGIVGTAVVGTAIVG